jgi:hypothetical protein
MRTFTLLEEGQSARSIYIRGDGEVTMFEIGRKIKCRVPMHLDSDTTWQLLSRVTAAIVQVEAVRLEIDRLVERVQTGWQPVASEIDPDVPQRTLRDAHFGIDALAYPDLPDEPYYAPPTLLLGRGEDGDIDATGEILWIGAAREWAICEGGFWWTP